MTHPFFLEREVIERLRRRVLSLETGAGLLRAEIEALASRLDSTQTGPPGRALDFGFERLFIPSDLNPGEPVEAYRNYLGLFWFGFDVTKTAPEIYVWHSPSGQLREAPNSNRHSLNIDLRARNQAKWLLWEFGLDWATLGRESQLSVVLVARASTAATIGVSLYAVDGTGEPLRYGFQELILGETPQISVAQMTLGDEFLRDADKTKPPKLHFNLKNYDSLRIEIIDLTILVPETSDEVVE